MFITRACMAPQNEKNTITTFNPQLRVSALGILPNAIMIAPLSRIISFWAVWLTFFNIDRHRTSEVVVQRPKQLAGKLKALAKGSQVPDIDECLGVDCAICADQLLIDNQDRNQGPVMTDCEHVSGHDCILTWLRKHDMCSMCRRKFVKKHLKNEQRIVGMK